MAVWLLAGGTLLLVLGLLVLLMVNRLAAGLAGAQNQPTQVPVAEGGTGHDRMAALIESQTKARRQQSRAARPLRVAGMGLTILAALCLAAGLFILLSQ